MFQFFLPLATLTLLPAAVLAQCKAAALKEATDRYVAAQSTGQAGWLQSVLGPNVTYIENNKITEFNHSALNQSIKIDFSRSFFDLTDCATVTEIIASDPMNPHVISTQIHYVDNKVTLIDSMTSGVDDWLFNASHTLHYALPEDWAPIAADQRDSREVIKAAGEAYFDIMKDPSTKVPWGYPCVRLEGGLYNGRGLANDTCNIGIPPGSNMTTPNKRYVIDENFGVVSILTTFTGLGDAPDSHLFRIEKGKLRFIHTVTNCKGTFNCGQGDIPPILSENVGF
jgi:hypothetical protein